MRLYFAVVVSVSGGFMKKTWHEIHNLLYEIVPRSKMTGDYCFSLRKDLFLNVFEGFKLPPKAQSG